MNCSNGRIHRFLNRRSEVRVFPGPPAFSRPLEGCGWLPCVRKEFLNGTRSLPRWATATRLRTTASDPNTARLHCGARQRFPAGVLKPRGSIDSIRRERCVRERPRPMASKAALPEKAMSGLLGRPADHPDLGHRSAADSPASLTRQSLAPRWEAPHKAPGLFSPGTTGCRRG